MTRHRTASALLSGLLGLMVAFCGHRASAVLPLTGTVWAAGSFVASPAAAAAAALHTLEDRAAPPSASPAPTGEPEAPAPAPAPAAPTPAPAPSPEAEPAPPGAGVIESCHYPQGEGERYLPCGAGTIKNCTALSRGELLDVIGQPGLPFAIEKNSAEPQVLIMHTHTTESYESAARSWYDPAATSRTTDPAANVVAVGTAMAEELNRAGIRTIQDTTLHDYPNYNGSYARSNQTVRGILAEHPGIKVVLDVHRDAIIRQDGTWIKPVADVPGTGPCAQVMIICGADQGGNLPRFRENLRFAARWQEAMWQQVPGLARPVLFDYRYYNQDLTTGSLLLEVGGHANTLEEAVNAGRLAGKALAQSLLQG